MLKNLKQKRINYMSGRFDKFFLIMPMKRAEILLRNFTEIRVTRWIKRE